MAISNVVLQVNRVYSCLSSGFAADAPTDALQTISTQSTQYKPEIEEDQVVSIDGN